MNIKTINHTGLSENVIEYTHKSGLKAYLIQKKGFLKKFVGFGTKYGSMNNKFFVGTDHVETNVPDGIAHFLEHKLFEQEYGSVMNKFSELGSSPNAYTSFNKTVYLFSCTDKFEENLELLLQYVQTPYLTDESIEKEKGIIEQEINMYQDNPGWVVYFNLLKAMYKNHPIKIDIAGTVESIKKIDKETLLKCYNTFYHPSNMTIVACGDIESHEFFNIVENNIKKTDYREPVKIIFPNETPEVYKKSIENRMQVNIPLFYIGYKDNNRNINEKQVIRRDVIMTTILEMLVGKSSELYNRLYNERYINGSFQYDYTIEKEYAHSIIGGESKDPYKVKDIIEEEIEKLKKSGLNKADFERIIKAKRGSYLRIFNSIEGLCNGFLNINFKGANLFDYLEVYDNIYITELNEVFMEHFSSEKLAISVIKPI